MKQYESHSACLIYSYKDYCRKEKRKKAECKNKMCYSEEMIGSIILKNNNNYYCHYCYIDKWYLGAYTF